MQGQTAVAGRTGRKTVKNGTYSASGGREGGGAGGAESEHREMEKEKRGSESSRVDKKSERSKDREGRIVTGWAARRAQERGGSALVR